MMIATKNLMDEHGGIKLMLTIMEGICKKLKAGKKVEVIHLDSILEFLKVFVDKCHHGKEEDVLFPSLLRAKQGQSARDAVRILNMEHTMGRKSVRKMAKAVSKYKKDGGKGMAIEENMAAYASRLKKHIESEKIGEGRHEEFHRLLRTLKKIYI